MPPDDDVLVSHATEIAPKRSLSEADISVGSPDHKRARHGSENGRRTAKGHKPRNRRKKTRKEPVVAVAVSVHASGSNHRLGSTSPRTSPERSTAPPSLPTSQFAGVSGLQSSRFSRSRSTPEVGSAFSATAPSSRTRSSTRASSSPRHDSSATASLPTQVQPVASSSDPTTLSSPTPPPADQNGSTSPCALKQSNTLRPPRASSLAHILNHQPIAGPSEQAPVMFKSRSPQEKGKGKAVEAHVAIDSRLSQELASQAELIHKHEDLLALFQPTLTCQICLDLMHRPFSLAPCGHTSCYTCLVSWFTAPPAAHPPGHPLPLAVNRKKTCPHCRADVREPPIEAWAVKDMVAALVKSGLFKDVHVPAPGPDANRNDPWDGIFKKAGEGQQHGRGLLDGEDGVYRCYDCMHEIWDGVCSGCGRFYGDDDEEAEDLAWLAAHGGGAPPDWFDPEDDEDELDAAMFDAPGFNPFAWMNHYVPGSEDGDEDDEDYPAFAHPHPDLDDEDEGYESSFIDDVDAPPPPLAAQADAVIDLTSDDEVLRPRRRAAAAIVDSDDEVEVLSSPPPQARGARGIRAGPIVISDDEDNEALDEEDTNINSEGSDPEEDDGSIRRPPMRFRRNGAFAPGLHHDDLGLDVGDHDDVDLHYHEHLDGDVEDDDDDLRYREHAGLHWDDDDDPYGGYGDGDGDVEDDYY